MNSRFPRPNKKYYQTKYCQTKNIPKKEILKNQKTKPAITSTPQKYQSKKQEILPKEKTTTNTSFKFPLNAKSSIDIDNKTFDIAKLYLIPRPHTSRVILAFKTTTTTFTNNIFYEQLTEGNKESINKLLFKLWDKYQPKRIDTNCGERSCPGFHCKLFLDDETFLQFLHSMGNDATINEHIEHYNQHKQHYTRKHEIHEAQYFQDDLRLYMNNFQANKNSWYPKTNMYRQNTSKPTPSEGICQELLFDIDDMQTALYLEHDTKQKFTEFKMIHYEKVVNKMIEKTLKAVKCLLKRTKEANYNNKIKRSLFEWFKLNFRSYQKQKTSEIIDDEKQPEMNNSIVIRVETHVSILNYLNFVFIYKKEWLKNKNNESLFNEWFRLYCNHIHRNHNDASKLQKSNIWKMKRCTFNYNKHKEIKMAMGIRSELKVMNEIRNDDKNNENLNKRLEALTLKGNNNEESQNKQQANTYGSGVDNNQSFDQRFSKYMNDKKQYRYGGQGRYDRRDYYNRSTSGYNDGFNGNNNNNNNDLGFENYHGWRGRGGGRGGRDFHRGGARGGGGSRGGYNNNNNQNYCGNNDYYDNSNNMYTQQRPYRGRGRHYKRGYDRRNNRGY